MSTAQSESFPFLRLPTEIRLLVYEHLPRQVKHTEVSIDGFVAILVTRHLPTAILRTSKLIRAEARPIIHRLIQEFIEESQTKIIEFSKSGSKMRHCKILECLKTQIPRERNAVEGLEDYDIQAILRRIPETRELQSTDPALSPNIARFMHQAARGRARTAPSPSSVIPASLLQASRRHSSRRPRVRKS